jgi:hypothetical protein
MVSIPPTMRLAELNFPLTLRRFVGVLAVSIIATGGIVAQEAPAKVTAAPDLPEDQLAAIAERERISQPAPADYFGSIAKATNPRWRKWYRELDPHPPAGRPRVAAGLGIVIAEAHLATMARDEQRLRNVGAEVSALSKVLGLADAVAPRLAAVEALAGAGNWGGVHVELEVLGWEVADGLRRQHDADLALLSSIGMWVRILHIGSSVVALGEVPDLALAAGGEGMPGQLSVWTNSLSESCRKLEPIAFSLKQVAKIGRIWDPEKFVGERTFTTEEVLDTRERLDSIISHLLD